jgi:hypothetical protein
LAVFSSSGSAGTALGHNLKVNCIPAKQCKLIERTIEIGLQPTAAPVIVVEPEIKPIVARELEPRPRKPVVVEIHYDAVKARYAAKDSRTGLLILRHEDRARLKGMCERMGWQVLDNEQQELECR